MMSISKKANWFFDGVILIALTLLALWLVRGFVSDHLFAWGDHPGQFMRFWYPLAHAMPESRGWLWGITGWNPTWYAGYPELQFYPPGATLVGIFYHYLTLGQLSPEAIYNLIPATALVLPLYTCYVFLRFALAPLGRIPSACGGIVAGLLAVSLKPMWGGVDGVMIGLMGERLAFGFAPVVMLAAWRYVEDPSRLRLVIAAGALAFLLLLHPFHAPAVMLVVAIYMLLRFQWRTPSGDNNLIARLVRHCGWFALWLLGAIGLIAWWLVPLLTHYTPYAAALVRATSDQVVSWFDAGRIEWLWLAGLMALMLLAQRHPRVEASVASIALLAPLLVGGILFNDRILFAKFGITMLDPIRFIAEYFLALILLVGCAVAAITSPFLWRIKWLAVICTVVVGITLPPYIETAWDDLHAVVDVAHEHHLDRIFQHPAFAGYWDALADDPTSGRIYFVPNYLFLTDASGAVTPTTANSLTPYLLGREIIGGTFSHWSPVARWLWVGDPWASLLPAQVESGEEQATFGQPWRDISPELLVQHLTGLNVTTIVTGPQDNAAKAVLDASPLFTRYWTNDFFTIYHLTGYESAWLEAHGATVRLLERTARHWQIAVESAEPGATLLVKQAHYPLWRASVDGTSLDLRPTANALQEIRLPTGAPYTINLVYRPGRAEWIGLAITLTTIVLMAALRFRRT